MKTIFTDIVSILTLKLAKKTAKEIALKILAGVLRERIKAFESKGKIPNIDESKIVDIVIKAISGERLTTKEKNFIRETASTIILNGNKIL